MSSWSEASRLHKIGAILFFVIGGPIAIFIILSELGFLDKHNDTKKTEVKVVKNYVYELIGDTVGEDMKWYGINYETLTGKPENCEVSKGPKQIIELHDNPLADSFGLGKLQQDDKLIGDVVVYSEMKDNNGTFTFFRGKERCERFLNHRKNEFNSKEQDKQDKLKKYD